VSTAMNRRTIRRRRAVFLHRTALRGGLLLLILAAFTLPACNRQPNGNPADGERWYSLHRCDGCHGEDGIGGRGPELAATELSFRRFASKIRSPHSTVMPAYDEQQLPDEDAADIYLWLVSLEK